MSEHVKVKAIVVAPKWGSTIQNVARECVLMAVKENRTVSFEFNSVTIEVDPEAIISFVTQKYYTRTEED